MDHPFDFQAFYNDVYEVLRRHGVYGERDEIVEAVGQLGQVAFENLLQDPNNEEG